MQHDLHINVSPIICIISVFLKKNAPSSPLDKKGRKRVGGFALAFQQEGQGQAELRSNTQCVIVFVSEFVFVFLIVYATLIKGRRTGRDILNI